MDTNVVVTIVLSFLGWISALAVAVAVIKNDINWLKKEFILLKQAQTNDSAGCTKRDIQEAADAVTLKSLGDTVKELARESRENNIRLTRIESKLNGM